MLLCPAAADAPTAAYTLAGTAAALDDDRQAGGDRRRGPSQRRSRTPLTVVADWPWPARPAEDVDGRQPAARYQPVERSESRAEATVIKRPRQAPFVAELGIAGHPAPDSRRLASW